MRLPMLVALVAFLLGQALAAQRGQIRRPPLPADADTNDAAAYYEWGSESSRDNSDAFAAFYWAYRLDPTHVYYLYARLRTEWARRPADWRWAYRAGVKRILHSKEARHLDSLWAEILLRDPFPQLPVDYCYDFPQVARIRDPVAAGSLLFDLGCFEQAATRLSEAIARHPEWPGLRIDRARALVFIDRAVEAVVELQAALDTLRASDEATLRYEYESKAFLEYMMGVAHVRRHDDAAAQAAFGRALAEDLAFYPAHAALAQIARRKRDVRGALQELAAALEIRDDGVLRHDYGELLLEAKQYADAEGALRRAIELEPYFADSYYHLGVALEALDRKPEAVDAYASYVARAPRVEGPLLRQARARIEALTGAAPSPY